MIQLEKIRHAGLLAVVLAIVVVAGSVWLASATERSTADRVFSQSRNTGELLTAQLDQETGLRGFALTHREEFLAPYLRGRRAYLLQLRQARALARGDSEVKASLDRQAELSRRWGVLAEQEIAFIRRGGRVRLEMVARRKQRMDGFRAATAQLNSLIEGRRREQLREASLVSVAVIVGLGGLLGTVGILLLRRNTRRERLRREELSTARDEALQLARAKSEFLANMSHEIRTPMNGVLGINALLLGTDLSGEQRRYGEIVRSSGESLLTIIDDILDFSKIEAGQLELDEAEFRLGPMLEDVCELVAGRAHDKRIELTSFVHPEVPDGVCGDQGRLRQVLMNLLSNAIKFTDEGEVAVELSAIAGSDDEVLIRFAVRDTGIGLGRLERARIFESFAQADTSTTRRYGGTGLGLTISRQLVEMLGGEIGVESEPGSGSTFWFTARLRQGASSEPSPRTAELAGLRVLIVDDNATNRTILERQLASWRMSARSASSGTQALEVLSAAAEEADPVQLVILDRQMPGTDGLDLARRIRSDPALSSLPLILLTSSTPQRAAAREAGISAEIAKPVRQSRLYSTIADAVAAARGAPCAAEASAGPEPTSPGLRSSLPILVAEDNETNTIVAVDMLLKRGLDVEVAGNGREALEKLSGKRFGLILMDCQMPVLDGYEATAEIRRLEGEDRHTPIVAMTAHSMEGDRERCLAAGMDGYISKPLSMEDLDDALRRWLDRTGSDGGSRELPEDRAPHGNGRRRPGRDANGGGLADQPLLDLETLGDLRGEPELLHRLLSVFEEEASGRLVDARAAHEEGDGGEIERLAHALRGSSAAVGATRMCALAAEVERDVQRADRETTRLYLERLEETFEQTTHAIEAEKRVVKQ